MLFAICDEVGYPFPDELAKRLPASTLLEWGEHFRLKAAEIKARAKAGKG